MVNYLWCVLLVQNCIKVYYLDIMTVLYIYMFN